MNENRRIIIEKEDGTHLTEAIVSYDESQEIALFIDEILERK